MSKGKYNLVCVAHPDDETIFFGGTILKTSKTINWRVVCATDGNADGDGVRRKKQFEAACKSLGVKQFDWLGLPDKYDQRLDLAAIEEALRAIPQPTSVFTHGILGEYGHPHHQDICMAVHRAFNDHKQVYSIAYNSFPEKITRLSESDFKKKAKILTDIYGSETTRFLNLLPVTFAEGFQRLSLKEVELLYEFFVHSTELTPSTLKRYPWLREFLSNHRNQKRPF